MMTNVRKDEALRVVLTLMSDVTEVHCTCMHIMKLKEDLATAIGSLYVTTVEPLYCMWIPWGPGKVSTFRGKLYSESMFGTQHSVLNTELEVSSFQGCPFKNGSTVHGNCL